MSMWGVVILSHGPVISPCICNPRILKPSEAHLARSPPLSLPPFSAAPRLLHRHVTLSAKNSPSPDHVGHLGQTLISTPKTNPNPNSNKRQSEPEILEGEGVQLSGSDVLWALQKATVRKKQQQQRQLKKKQMEKMKMKVSSHNSSGNENPPMDYSKVKPLCIISDWGDRLDELEKRLKELPQTI